MTFQRRYGDLLLVAYDELANEPANAIRRIASHLGLIADDAAVLAADRRSGQEAVAAIATHVSDFPAEAVYRDEHYLYDRRTLIHRNHLTGAGARWATALTPVQVAEIQQKTHPWAELWPTA
jgi:hypothetical protein